MSDSVFNPDLFLSTTTDQAGDTRYTPVPVGEWTGQVKDVKARRTHSDKTGLDASGGKRPENGRRRRLDHPRLRGYPALLLLRFRH